MRWDADDPNGPARGSCELIRCRSGDSNELTFWSRAVRVLATMAPGGNAVSKQTDYTSEEWAAITSAPALASMLVSMVDLSGPIGLLQEARAGYKAAIAAYDAGSSEIVHAVAHRVKSGTRPDLSSLPKGRAPRRAAMIAQCRAAVALVAAKSPAEAESYARWLLAIATATAQGAKEDTFLGFGGVQV